MATTVRFPRRLPKIESEIICKRPMVRGSVLFRTLVYSIIGYGMVYVLWSLYVLLAL